MNKALEALAEVDFNWTRSLDSVWSDAGGASAGPNEAVLRGVLSDFLKDTKALDAKPNGRVLVGQSGIGKTHLVGLLRARVWQAGGWFVLLDVLGLTDFWRSAALSVLTSLLQEMPGGRRQLEAVLGGVARRFKIEQEVETAFNTPDIEPRQIVDLMIGGLMRTDMSNTLRHQDIFRALSLLRSRDLNMVSLAHSWLQGYDADEQARAALGFRGPPPAPVDLVRGMSWIMSLAGPTLVAVDQIDGVVNPSTLNLGSGDDPGAPQGLGEVLAAGLLELHDVRHRGQTVITCLYDSWEMIKGRGMTSARQRFGTPVPLVGMNDKAAVATLLASRLAPAFAAVGCTPPSPTWPFSETAIAGAAAAGMMPRTILMRCDAFRRACLDQETIRLCDTLLEREAASLPPGPDDPSFDLAARQAVAAIGELIDPDDDAAMGRLLRDVLDLYVRQIDPDEAVDVVSKADPAQKIPPLHGRLTFTYHDQNDRERHFCFRALDHTHAISFQARLRAALTASGISSRIADRHLVLLRRLALPTGTKTRALVEAFEKAGGRFIDPTDDDLRRFVALRQMREEAVAQGRQDVFEAWLRAEKPLDDTSVFKAAGLSPAPEVQASGAGAQSMVPAADLAPPAPEPKPVAATVPADRRTAEAAEPVPPPRLEPGPADAIPLGWRMSASEDAVFLPTRLLPRHVSIIAGSGSGKTVLLRRLVEEAALAGIPAIVIDPNNDLSRLGDAWPERPAAFSPEDDDKARRYREGVEVIVWTPGLHAGNPLFLPVMPDFASLGDSPDERQQAIEMAAETLGPLAGARTELQRGVLVDALRYFARRGGDLKRFTALLADLPDGLSQIGAAHKLGIGMADRLHAAVATNPLLKADGPVLDPKTLFYGPDPKRVRLSVINLSGLGSDAAREDFVNRLQMTLFGWIKKNPSPTGRLYVIDEAQMFLPAQRGALSLGSGTRLVAQARKYGLGMIVATQVPRGIHNHVAGNCTTQFFGKQSAPTPIHAAQEIIAASGGRADDLGKLKAGEFYFLTEGSGKPGKLRTPLCLSHHPANPPTPEEVIIRARRSAP